MKEYGHIAVSLKLKKEVDKMKIHPDETYENIIRRAINALNPIIKEESDGVKHPHSGLNNSKEAK